jgi:hypothetical protein
MIWNTPPARGEVSAASERTRGDCEHMIDDVAAAGRTNVPPAVELDVPIAPADPLPAVPQMPAGFVPPAPDEHLRPDAASGAAAIS